MSNIVFPERESKLLEFKSKVTDFAALIKTSIAFANAAGGRIVIGVDDKTREIMGITENDRCFSLSMGMTRLHLGVILEK